MAIATLQAEYIILNDIIIVVNSIILCVDM